MQIYLKGYYGYQNFGDELLLFGVIEEIFTRYPVKKLVIEVGNKAWIQDRKNKNLSFISEYYRTHGVEVDWDKIQFFQPDERSQKEASIFLKSFLPKKRVTYLLFLLGKHPYHSFFKIFGGGEVIDENRNFPHNGRNILLLYFFSFFHGNFALRGGFGTQKRWTTKLLSILLFKKAYHILARDDVSYLSSKKYNQNTEKIYDLSFPILKYFLASSFKTTLPLLQPYAFLNISPQARTIPLLSDKVQWYFFPSDIEYDFPFLEKLPFKIESYDWTKYSLAEILLAIKKSTIGIGSRLHFLYCYKVFGVAFSQLHQSAKLERNL